MKQYHPPFRLLMAGLLAFTGLETSRAQAPVSGEPGPLRVAILSGRETQAEADLLSTHLSDRKGLILLERADLSAIAAEGSLISGNLPAFLESADALILVEEIRIHSDSYLATRIVGRDDGTVHASDLRARASSGPEWGNLLAQKLGECAKQPGDGTKAVPTVAVRAIREEFVAGARENVLESIAITRFLNAELAKSPRLRVLERVDLTLVQFEQLLTRIDSGSFQEADHLISGTYRSKDGKAGFEVFVETPGGKRTEKLEADLPTDDLGSIAAAMAAAIVPALEKISAAPPTNIPARTPSKSFAFGESQRFSFEAERTIRLGLHEAAANFAEAAHLLDQGDGFQSLHVLACAEFFASIPSLRGRGINMSGAISVERPDRVGNEALVFANLFPNDERTDVRPIPEKEVMDALARASERILDLTRLAHTLEPKRQAGVLNSLFPFIQIVSTTINEALLDGFAAYGSEVPASERESLLRIAAASKALASVNDEAEKRGLKRGPSILHRFPDYLMLETSPQGAIEQLRSLLYGDEIKKLAGSPEQVPEASWFRAETARSGLFGYFEYLGYDESLDDSTSLIDERIFGKPFVAWLSGTPVTFEAAFADALAGAGKEDHLLALVDAKFSAAGSARTREARAREFGALRNLLLEQIDELKGLGMLELYAYQLAQWERDRDPGAAEEDRGAFWRTVHTAVCAEDAWTSGRLTDTLVTSFDGRSWFESEAGDPGEREAFLRSLRQDLATNQHAAAEPRRRNSLKTIDDHLGELAAASAPSENRGPYDTRAVQGLEGIPGEETIELKAVSFGYYLPTLATEVTDEGIFSFQHGDADYDRDTHLLRFNLAGTIDRVPAPKEIYELVEAAIDPETLNFSLRAGDLRVSTESIEITFPGGRATYHRNTKTWDVTPIPFLKGRNYVRMAGEKIVSVTGAIYGFPSPPVQGVYVTDPKTMEHTAMIDTSRRPAKSLIEMSGNLRLTVPPVQISADRVFVGITGNVLDQDFFQFKLAGNPDDPMSHAVPFPFVTGPGAVVHGSTANGYVLVAAIRKTLRKSGEPVENEKKMRIGAVAFDKEGKSHWLLDTGTSPAGLSGRSEQYHHPDRKMSPDHIKDEPLFHFPESYSLHRGEHPLNPVLHYNGTRLILLTGQITKDGRRLMYVWKNAEQKTPKRFALRFSGFEWMEDLNEEEKADWNLIARDSILSIFEWRDRLVFEYPRGFFHLRIEEFEGYLNR